MINKDGFTPKEAAYSTLIDWARALAENEDRAEEVSTTPLGNPSKAFSREYKIHLRRLHNKLLKDSGLDGLELDEHKEEE